MNKKKYFAVVLLLLLLVFRTVSVQAENVKDTVSSEASPEGAGGLGTTDTGPEKTAETVTKLAVPKLVSVKSKGYDSVEISWSAVPGAKSYNLYYKGYKVSKWRLIREGIKGTSYVHKSSKAFPLVTGQNYTYTVRAVCDSVISGYEKAGITTAPQPGVTRMLRFTSKGYNKVKLTWSKVSGATGYALYYKKAGGNWKKIAITDQTSCVFTGTAKHPIQTGETYSYTVRAFRKVNNENIYGKRAENTIQGKTLPEKPVLVSIACPAQRKITITWKKAPGADAYLILRQTADGKWQQVGKVSNANTLTYTHKSSKKYPVETGKVYRYTVQAYTVQGAAKSSYNTTGLKVTATPPKYKWKESNNESYCYDTVSGKKLTGMSKVDGKYYYFTSGGAQRVGWQKIGDAYYYFNIAKDVKGYRVSSKTINGIWLGSDGRASVNSSTSEKVRLLAKANVLVSSLTNLNMTDYQRLRKCFEYAKSQFRYRNIGGFHSQGNWDQYYAGYFFDRGYGDCYTGAVGFAYLAAAAGFSNVNVVSSGGHGWAEVNGLVSDPNWSWVTNNTDGYFNISYSLSGVGGRPSYARNRYYVRQVS